MKYFVYIETKMTGHHCPYFETLEEAMELYNETQMKSFSNNIFLGIASNTVTPSSGYCFDVLHKFFDDQILINDYLNYVDKYPEIKETVKEIISKYFIRYQFTPWIVGGALIDYASPFAISLSDRKIEDKWNEIYISSLKRTTLMVVGWRKNNWRTYDAYGWNWPKRCAYVDMMNVTAYDKNGHPHEVDVDPRDYLLALGKKISISKERGE